MRSLLSVITTAVGWREERKMGNWGHMLWSAYLRALIPRSLARVCEAHRRWKRLLFKLQFPIPMRTLGTHFHNWVECTMSIPTKLGHWPSELGPMSTPSEMREGCQAIVLVGQWAGHIRGLARVEGCRVVVWRRSILYLLTVARGKTRVQTELNTDIRDYHRRNVELGSQYYFIYHCSRSYRIHREYVIDAGVSTFKTKWMFQSRI